MYHRHYCGKIQRAPMVPERIVDWQDHDGIDAQTMEYRSGGDEHGRDD